MSTKIVPSSAVFRVDLALLLIRLILALVFFVHGTQKLLGWFGGKGLAGATQGFTSMGIPLPGISATSAAVIETAGALLLLIGFLTRSAAFLLTITMLVAAFAIRAKGFAGGFEFPLTLAVVCFALTLTGPGRLAARRKPKPTAM